MSSSWLITTVRKYRNYSRGFEILVVEAIIHINCINLANINVSSKCEQRCTNFVIYPHLISRMDTSKTITSIDHLSERTSGSLFPSVRRALLESQSFVPSIIHRPQPYELTKEPSPPQKDAQTDSGLQSKPQRSR